MNTKSSAFMKSSIMISAVLILIAPSAIAGTWRDDFNDGDLNGWSIHGNGILWSVQQGALSGKWIRESVMESKLTHYLNAGWQDYIVTCRIKFIEEYPSEWPAFINVGVRYRMEKLKEQLEGMNFWVNLNNRAGFESRYHGWVYGSQGEDTPPIFLGTWHEIKVIAKDYFYFGYVDGVLVDSIEKDVPRKWIPPTGGIALSVRYAHVLFDDVTVSGVDIAGPLTPHGKLSATWGRLKAGDAR